MRYSRCRVVGEVGSSDDKEDSISPSHFSENDLQIFSTSFSCLRNILERLNIESCPRALGQPTARGLHSTVTMSFSEIPILDLSEARSEASKPAFLEQLRDALINVGFLYIKNTGIDQELYDEICAEGIRFFDLPDNEKAKIDMINQKSFLGYAKVRCDTAALHPVSVSQWLIDRVAAGYGSHGKIQQGTIGCPLIRETTCKPRGDCLECTCMLTFLLMADRPTNKIGGSKLNSVRLIR